MYKPKCAMSLETLMHKKYVQQQARDDKKFHQSRTKLDEEIGRLCMLMKRMTGIRYKRRKRTSIGKVKLTKQICINNQSGREKHRVSNLREVNITLTVGKQHAKIDTQLQHKVWDLGGFRN